MCYNPSPKTPWNIGPFLAIGSCNTASMLHMSCHSSWMQKQIPFPRLAVARTCTVIVIVSLITCFVKAKMEPRENHRGARLQM